MILSWLTFLILFIEVLILCYLDHKIWGTIFTPFSFLSVPYVIILFSALIFARSLNFFQIVWESILIWNIGLFIFWLPSLFFGVVVLKKTGIITKTFNNIPTYYGNGIILNAIIILFLLLIFKKIIYLSETYGLGSKEFVQYNSVGIEAHLGMFLKVILIYYIAIIKKKDKFLALIILLILFNFAISGSKSWFLIPIITGLLVRMVVQGDKNIKISGRLIISIGALVFITFFIIYYFTVGNYLNLSEYLHFLIKHIGLYFNSGIISFSEYVKNVKKTGIDYQMIILPIINLFKKLTGHEIRQTYSSIWIPVNSEGDIVNVKTMIGSMYIYAGWFKGMIFLFVFSFLHYSILYLSLIIKNIFLTIIYFFWCSLLLFGWFEIYYINLAFYEVPFWSLIAYILSIIRIKKGNK